MIIGVFHPVDPFAVMPPERIKAIVAEAERQQVKLIFFNESEIDLEARIINGWVSDADGLKASSSSFPQAVMNVRPWSPLKRSEKEIIFRNMVPFTAFLIGSKWEVTKKLVDHPVLAPYIVPTYLFQSLEQIDELFLQHEKLVIKPAKGSRGEGVQGLIREGNRYVLQTGTDWVRMNPEELLNYMQQLNKKYLVQPYIVCLTPEGEPFDFRILAQRNGQGLWSVPLIYPRIGESGTITSNVSISGRTEPLLSFVKRMFPDTYEMIPKMLHDLGIVIAKAVNKHYQTPLNELGIDLAIDREGRVWFYEANTCPGTHYHEAERAVLAIAYTSYVAKKFEWGLDALRFQDAANMTLGLLIDGSPEELDLQSYVDVASTYDVQLVCFQLDDIEFGESSITGYRIEDRQWQKGEFPFPHFVYSLADPEDPAHTMGLHSHTSNLRFLSAEPKGPISSTLFYALMSQHALLRQYLPEYLSPERPEEAKAFIDRHSGLVMKSDTAEDLEDIILIHRLPTSYEVRDPMFVHSFNNAEMMEFLNLFDERRYILIEQINSRTSDGHPLHVRVFLLKDSEGKWKSIAVRPIMVLNTEHPRQGLPLSVSWDWLLEREFSECPGMSMDSEIQSLAHLVAEHLEQLNHKRTYELIVDFAIQSDKQIYLLGAEWEGPREVVHPYEIARHVIPYALKLWHTQKAIPAGLK